jgi:hypothetical protein
MFLMLRELLVDGEEPSSEKQHPKVPN